MTNGVVLAVNDPITRDRINEWQEDLEDEARQQALEDQALRDVELSDGSYGSSDPWNDLNDAVNRSGIFTTGQPLILIDDAGSHDSPEDFPDDDGPFILAEL